MWMVDDCKNSIHLIGRRKVLQLKAGVELLLMIGYRAIHTQKMVITHTLI